MSKSVPRMAHTSSSTVRCSRLLIIAIVVTLISSSVPGLQVVEQALDPGFGKDGKVTIKFPGGFSEARAVVVQTDGKIVAAGHNAGSANSDFALARFNPNGSLDATFGDAGKVATDFSVTSDRPFALVLQPDSKIIAAGAVNNFGFGLARYNIDGSLDPSFGIGGKVTTPSTSFAGALAAALQPNGKIVVAGLDLNQIDRDFAIARFNSDGSIDPTFGTAGRVSTNFGGSEAAHALVLQLDGKILAAGGETLFVTQANFKLARYNSDGSLDSTFGPGGKVTTDFFGNFDQANGLALQADGKILCAGVASRSTPAFNNFYALARYNTNGTLDATFGSAGLVTTALGIADGANAVAIQPDGKIIVAGSNSNNVNPADFGLLRYNTDGSLDTGFGLNGKVATDFGGGETVNAISLQPDGKIVAAGSTTVGPASELAFALARYQSNGTLDLGFGSAGKVTTEFFSDSNTANAVAIQLDGKIVLAGLTRRKNTSGDMALARLSPNGKLDPSFGSGGQVVTDFSNSEDAANAIAIQPDGKILAAGFANTPGGGQDFALVRYNADGSLDSGFGSGGKVTTAFFAGAFDEARAIALQPDGKIILAGRAQVSFDSFAYDFALARYNTDGSLDPTFGSDGKVTTDILSASADEANALMLQPDGKILAAGSARSSSSSVIPDFALVRYNDRGRLDSGFGSAGRVTTDFFGSFDQATAIALQSDGKIVLAGVANPDFTLANSDFALARYSPDGNLDSTFGSGGKVTTNFLGAADEAKALALEPNGKLVAAGNTNGFGGSRDFALAHYNGDGILDPGFGAAGKVVIDFFGSVDSGNALALQPDGKIVVAGVALGGIGLEFAVARYEVPVDFALGLDPPAITTARGRKVRVKVNINRTGGLINSVTVTPPDTSALGIKVIPPDPVSTTEDSVKFKLKIKAAAQTGTHRLVFTGRDSSGRVRTVELTLTVQ